MRVKALFKEDLCYEDSHSWLKVEGDLVRVGVDDIIQQAAGKLVYVNPLRPGAQARRGMPLISLEASKWVGSINSPVTGTVVVVNQEVLRKPSLVNEDPYGRGWILLIKPSNLEEDLRHLRCGEEARKWFESEAQRLLRKVA
ncbi:MAG: glycine cleavage system protein H [Thermoprotei archaeon]|nr:MAG: glycine cleavage system protein H [Thermoprotei archaeon]